MTNNYYLSLQYSAIQKTVLRHDRLWSIAGISNTLARLNEIDLPDIAKKHDDDAIVIVAGGGKFTACFTDPVKAENARNVIRQKLSTLFPMLEFQMSEVVAATSFFDAKENKKILDTVNEQKQRFRGYAASYLPHLAVCAECGEFPAEGFKISVKEDSKWKDRKICRTCKIAYDQAQMDFSILREKTVTTLEQVYLEYFDKVKVVPGKDFCQPLKNFDDMFPDDDTGDKTSKKRMAVWFSDLNNMNQKVPIWLGLAEKKILDTFNTVKKENISVIASALAQTFPSPKAKYLPFRIVVAGGDDLCLVMPEQYILDFTSNLAQAVNDKITELNKKPDNPLNTDWLQEQLVLRPDPKRADDKVKPYSFGACFVLASLHTPFKAIHALGEELMGKAKTATDRQGNSVNWRIMAEDGAVADTLLKFERPLFVDPPAEKPKGWDKLTFAEYMKLRDKYIGVTEAQQPLQEDGVEDGKLIKKFKGVTGSHRFAIVDRLIRFGKDPAKLTTELKKYDSNMRVKSFSDLLTEGKLQRGGVLDPERLATLLELLSIKKSDDPEEERL